MDIEELTEWIETMNLQNTNGRESPNEMFKLGIKATIEDLIELKLLKVEDIIKLNKIVK